MPLKTIIKVKVMYNKTDKQYDQLEKMEVFYKEMENNQFRDDF